MFIDKSKISIRSDMFLWAALLHYRNIFLTFTVPAPLIHLLPLNAKSLSQDLHLFSWPVGVFRVFSLQPSNLLIGEPLSLTSGCRRLNVRFGDRVCVSFCFRFQMMLGAAAATLVEIEILVWKGGGRGRGEACGLVLEHQRGGGLEWGSDGIFSLVLCA